MSSAGTWLGPRGRVTACRRRIVGAACLALVFGGCRQDMHDQPRYRPLARADFYRDGSSARLPVEGTVARGQLRDDEHLYTGRIGASVVEIFPFPITGDVVRRGRDQFDVFCAPCHSRLGNGDGVVVRRGFQRPPTLHSERLRQMPVGHFYGVITNGLGGMPRYGALVPVADRWAIVAYIRALQLSQHAPAAELSADDRSALERAEASVQKQ